MTAVLDTNALLQIFSTAAPLAPILTAVRNGWLRLAVTTPVLLEYEEVVLRSSGRTRWEDVWHFLTLSDALHGNILYISPGYRFHTIIGDPDDDTFADCAIAADAEFIITSDHHFDALIGSGYRPQPVTPEDFIRLHLTNS